MSIYSKTASTAFTQTEISEYGSSRLGVYNIARPAATISFVDFSNFSSKFERANKFFELSNHLGNVLVTVSDKKLPHATNGSTVDYYTADVVGANDYYPGGMTMPAREYSAGSEYRYGFNGKENDKDISEGGQDYGMRIYDARLARFLSEDPLISKYPMLTPYQFASNRPIDGIDFDGLEYMPYPAALTIKLSLESIDGKIKRVQFGQIVPQHLPDFYKSIGATTQSKFEAAFKNTQYKIDQLNPPDLPASNRAQAVEALMQWIAKSAASLTPEVKAHEEMIAQIGKGNASVNLVDAASSLNLLPKQFASDLNFKQNLINYVLDGSYTQTGFGEKLENYNSVIQAVGSEIFANRDKVQGGIYHRKTQETVAIHFAPIGLDYQTMGAQKIIGVESKKIDPPYQQSLEKYNKSTTGCVNCTTIQKSSK